MTKHDEIRMIRALNCDVNDEESLADAVRGLQSTDDPSLLPLHDKLMDIYRNKYMKKDVKPDLFVN